MKKIIIFNLLIVVFLAGCTQGVKLGSGMNAGVQGEVKPVATDLAGYWRHVESRTNPTPLSEEWFVRADGTGVQCIPSASPPNSKLIVSDYAHIVVNNLDFKLYRDTVNSFFAMNKKAGKTLYFKRTGVPSDACKSYFAKQPG